MEDRKIITPHPIDPTGDVNGVSTSNVFVFEAPLPPPLSGSPVTSLDEIVAGVHDGSISAFAVVAHPHGYSRYSSWRGRSLADCYNLLGQLAALQSDIIAFINSNTSNTREGR